MPKCRTCSALWHTNGERGCGLLQPRYKLIAILDYDMGNLKSVQKAFEHLGEHVCVTRKGDMIAEADKLVVPGVGAFRDCMENLKHYKLVDPILKHIESGKPYLGICLGMQVLFTESEEFGKHKGLDVIHGKVVRFPHDPALKVPHMGWHQIHKVEAIHESPLQKIPDNSYVYFVHSYYVLPKDKKVIATTTDYGMEFCSSIQKDNIFATQFHLEKSQKVGLKILEAFSKL